MVLVLATDRSPVVSGSQPIRLADFMEANMEAILADWVAFAATCGPAGRAMDLVALRDHAADVLKGIIVDLRTPQTPTEQSEKSKGNAEAEPGAADTAAEIHGAGRAGSGFSMGEMVAEYRALRASVLRLWARACGTLTGAALEDMTRFNEAIDQALAESVRRFSIDLDHSREMFLAILGHDLRSPIGAVLTSSQFMLDTAELREPFLTLTSRIARAARRMNNLVSDLLDITRSRLGAGMPITRAPMDLGREAAHAVDEMRGAHPDAQIQYHASGALRGEWDCARITQVLTNLLGNAVQYGSPGMPIELTVFGDTSEVTVSVHNRGPAIPPEDLAGLFSPLKRLQPGEPSRRLSDNLGLGLYIAERIVTAHAGRIEVRSTPEAGTTFTVHLPR